MSFPALLAAVAARGPRCIRCRAWTMEPDQSSYTHPMCDRCATTLEALRLRFMGVSGPADHPVRTHPGTALKTPVCQECFVWECLACGWKRKNARSGQRHTCTRCGRTNGKNHPVRHWRRGHVVNRKV